MSLPSRINVHRDMTARAIKLITNHYLPLDSEVTNKPLLKQFCFSARRLEREESRREIRAEIWKEHEIMASTAN